MASRTTARASSATKSGSRTPNTSSGSSGYDYDAAEQARREALRRKIIEDNKTYIIKIQATNAEIKETRDMINQAKTLLANAVSGEKYEEYSKYLKDQDAWLDQISNDLNARGEKAAKNINEKGEAYIFNRNNTEPDYGSKINNNKPLSVNTDELQKLVGLLDGISAKGSSISGKVSDIVKDSSKLGIYNASNSADKSRDVVYTNITLQEKLRQQINETEKTEKENLGIVDKIYGWFSGLFKSSDDKKLNDLGTDEAKKENMKQKNIEAEEARKKLIKEQSGTDAAREEQFAIKNNSAKSTPGSRTINAAPRDISELKGMSEIITVAKANDVSTKGKSKREILEELAIKLGIPIAADPTKKQSRLERTTNET